MQLWIGKTALPLSQVIIIINEILFNVLKIKKESCEISDNINENQISSILIVSS